MALQTDLNLHQREFLLAYARLGNATEAAIAVAKKPHKNRVAAACSGYSALRKCEEILGGKDGLWEYLGLTLSKVVKTLDAGMEAKELKVVVVPGGRGTAGDVREYEVEDHRSRIRAAEVAGRLISPPRQRLAITGANDGPIEIRFKYLGGPRGDKRD